MNERDFAREMRAARKERVQQLAADPVNNRRLELIEKMRKQEGKLSAEDLRELRRLQRACHLPDDI